LAKSAPPSTRRADVFRLWERKKAREYIELSKRCWLMACVSFISRASPSRSFISNPLMDFFTRAHLNEPDKQRQLVRPESHYVCTSQRENDTLARSPLKPGFYKVFLFFHCAALKNRCFFLFGYFHARKLFFSSPAPRPFRGDK
jgi:hypothetical protein